MQSTLKGPIMKKLNIWLQTTFYVVAGINHFLNPDFYLELIPPYFGEPELINLLSGVVEVILGIGLLIPRFRMFAAWGIILMLISFIPSHIYFVEQGSCIKDGGLCVPDWVGWGRLLVIHPLLMLWAWTAR